MFADAVVVPHEQPSPADSPRPDRHGSAVGVGDRQHRRVGSTQTTAFGHKHRERRDLLVLAPVRTPRGGHRAVVATPRMARSSRPARCRYGRVLPCLLLSGDPSGFQTVIHARPNLEVHGHAPSRPPACAAGADDLPLPGVRNICPPGKLRVRGINEPSWIYGAASGCPRHGTASRR